MITEKINPYLLAYYLIPAVSPSPNPSHKERGTLFEFTLITYVSKHSSYFQAVMTIYL